MLNKYTQKKIAIAPCIQNTFPGNSTLMPGTMREKGSEMFEKEYKKNKTVLQSNNSQKHRNKMLSVG